MGPSQEETVEAGVWWIVGRAGAGITDRGQQTVQAGPTGKGLREP